MAFVSPRWASSVSRGDGLADHDADGFVHAGAELLDEERHAERGVQVARDLEEAGVGALEEDRDHGRVGLGDHLGGEGAPARVHRPARRAWRRWRRCRPGRRRWRRLARGRRARSCGSRGSGRTASFVSSKEIGRTTRSRSSRLAEDAMGKDAEVAAHSGEDVAHHQPVEDAVGVVRDRMSGPVFGMMSSAPPTMSSERP